MEKRINITTEKKKYYDTLLSMTGTEIYNKYGLKRDEAIFHTVRFENNIEMDIKLVIGDCDDHPYTEAVLFQNGKELCCSDPEESFLDEWELEYNNEIFTVFISVELIECSCNILECKYLTHGLCLSNILYELCEYSKLKKAKSALENEIKNLKKELENSIKMPCKIGDTVYSFCKEFGQVLDYTLESVSKEYFVNETYYTISAYSVVCGEGPAECLDEKEITLEEFGKSVFLSKEEALAAVS